MRRHRGAFITITQGIKDFSASKEAEAAWNNSSTKITLLQDAKAFKQYLADNPDQFSDMEKEVIRGFQPALQTGYELPADKVPVKYQAPSIACSSIP